MSYSTLVQVPFAREKNSAYSSNPFKEMVYEVSLKTAPYRDWLGELQGAHRLLQTLLQGQIMGNYHLLDFLIQPEGLFARVTLKNGSLLFDFLTWVKEKSCPAGESTRAFWNDELQWIKLVPPDRLAESTRLFLKKAESLHREVHLTESGPPELFFFYRDQRFTS